MQDTLTNPRPDDCECWSATQGLPCAVCWIAGYETPNPEVFNQ